MKNTGTNLFVSDTVIDKNGLRVKTVEIIEELLMIR